MQRWICYAGIGLLLSGCAGPVVLEVKIPIPVPCVSAIPVRPESALDRLPLEASVFESAKALLVDRERIGAYTGNLEALLEACR